MEYFSDIFLGAAAIAAAIYCLVLSRKLSRLKGLDQDLGGAIAVLSQQVDGMTKKLAETQDAANASSQDLAATAARAEAASNKLETLFAALHDLPEAQDGDAASAEDEASVAPSDQPLFVRHGRDDRNGASQ